MYNGPVLGICAVGKGFVRVSGGAVARQKQAPAPGPGGCSAKGELQGSTAVPKAAREAIAFLERAAEKGRAGSLIGLERTPGGGREVHGMEAEVAGGAYYREVERAVLLGRRAGAPGKGHRRPLAACRQGQVTSQ